MLWTVVLAAYLTVMRWTGLSLTLAVLVTAYVALIAFFRLRCGFRRGYKIAALGTAVLVGCSLLYPHLHLLSLKVWRTALATGGFGFAVGLAVGFVAFTVVHVIVRVVDVVDKLMQTRIPKD